MVNHLSVVTLITALYPSSRMMPRWLTSSQSKSVLYHLNMIFVPCSSNCNPSMQIFALELETYR